MSDELRRQQRTINLAMLIAIALVLGRLLLLGVAEIVPFGAELGQFLYDLGLAYATAWFFQWLVIVRPDSARRKALNKVMSLMALIECPQV